LFLIVEKQFLCMVCEGASKLFSKVTTHKTQGVDLKFLIACGFLKNLDIVVSILILDINHTLISGMAHALGPSWTIFQFLKEKFLPKICYASPPAHQVADVRNQVSDIS
jgi:hypothetical protein